MGKFKFFFLTLAALACLLMSGCGSNSDDSSYLLTYRPSGKFLYVNNNSAQTADPWANLPNYVSAFAINADGTLDELDDSPYATGDDGRFSSFYGSKPIALAPLKRLLFVANKGGDTITVFRANQFSGELTQIGDPVASGDVMGDGGSMVVDDQEHFLFVTHAGLTSSIAVFSIDNNGTLTPVTNSPFVVGSEPDGITLNLVGSYLYVATPNTNELVVLSVADDGQLAPIAGSPFAYAGPSFIASLAISSATLGLSIDGNGVVTSYSLAEDGTPTAITSLASGTWWQCITTLPKKGLAFISGAENPTIGAMQVAEDGTLTVATGSPVATYAYSTGFAVANPKGTFLFTPECDSSYNGFIETFSIGDGGELTSVATISFSNPGFATGLVVY